MTSFFDMNESLKEMWDKAVLNGCFSNLVYPPRARFWNGEFVKIHENFNSTFLKSKSVLIQKKSMTSTSTQYLINTNPMWIIWFIYSCGLWGLQLGGSKLTLIVKIHKMNSKLKEDFKVDLFKFLYESNSLLLWDF